MSDETKPDLKRIRQVHRSLRHHKDVSQSEWFHRIAIALLLIMGFIGFFFGHLRSLFFVGIVYFVVAIWQGLISFHGRRLGRGAWSKEKDDET